MNPVGKGVRSTTLGATLFVALMVSCSTGGSNPIGPSSSGTISAASYARAQAQTPNPGQSAGSIAGRIGYPTQFVPAQAIYAITTDGSRFYRVEGAVGQQQYTLVGVRAGDYFVFSATRAAAYVGAASAARTAPAQRFEAGYTKVVHVVPGATTSGIDPVDFYVNDPGYYPLIPGGGSPLLTLPIPPAAFATADEAAAYLAQSKTSGRLTPSHEACPVNIACVWLSGRRDGHAAAYFVGAAGSNNDVQTCAFYLVNDAGRWETLDSICSNAPTPFPAVGSTGMVLLGMGETGCVNVHVAPGVSAKVVACLSEGTQVQIDDGPYFIPPANAFPSTNPPGALDYWWHIAGRGWMVHQYLWHGSPPP